MPWPAPSLMVEPLSDRVMLASPLPCTEIPRDAPPPSPVLRTSRLLRSSFAAAANSAMPRFSCRSTRSTFEARAPAQSVTLRSSHAMIMPPAPAPPPPPLPRTTAVAMSSAAPWATSPS